MDFLSIWKRIVDETDLNKMYQLADFVDVSQQFVSKKKKQNDFPVEWAFKVAQEFNLSTDWIMTGEGPKSLNESKEPASYKFETLKYLEQWLTELIVNEPNRREWFKVSVEDAFPMFKAWMKRREEQEGKNSNPPQSKIG